MANRSGPKGDEFERLMAKKLNEAYETEEFAKTPGSGALMGLTNFGKKMGLSEAVRRTLASDLIVPDWFKFSVECKWYKNSPNYAAIIKGADSDLDGWLGETLYDAINTDLVPLLFFKTNNKGIHAVLPKYFGRDMSDTRTGDWIIPQYFCGYGDFVIFGLDYFLDNRRVFVDYATNMQKSWIDTWYTNSEHVKYLLENLKKVKAKQKNKPRKRK